MKRTSLALTAIALIAGCASMTSSSVDYTQEVTQMLRNDFTSKGPATLERIINRDEAQQLCSLYPADVPKDVADKIEKAQMQTIKYPADGNYLGDWKQGETIAQSGRGMQSSDAIGAPSGGNCYACHQISKAEISYGNIGPSLYQYGKLRGDSEAILKYTWGKVYNSEAYNACSNMPRYGHNGILTEKQIKDVMALLLDPKSPVNQ